LFIFKVTEPSTPDAVFYWKWTLVCTCTKVDGTNVD